MLVYFIGFAITLVFAYLAKYKAKSKKLQIFFIILAAIPFLLVSALRYDIGTDYTRRYVKDYLTLGKGKDVVNLEIGFKWLVKFCLLFSKDPYILFAITSLIIVGSFFLLFYKRSENIILSIVVFLTGMYFFASLNILRQYLATSFILIGYIFLTQKNTKISYTGFIICGIMATLIHSSSAVCFVIIFFTRKMWIHPFWIIPICFMIVILNENLMNALAFVIEKTRFKNYLHNKFATGDLSILYLIVNMAIYLWMYFIYLIRKKNNLEIDKQAIVLFNIQGIAVITTALGAVYVLFNRIAMYFMVFQTISIPYYYTITPYKQISDAINKKLKLKLKEKSVKIVTLCIIILSFTALFSYTYKDHEAVPYKSIFSNEAREDYQKRHKTIKK